MDLSVKAIHDIIHPTAVFSKARHNARHHPVVADGFRHLHPSRPHRDIHSQGRHGEDGGYGDGLHGGADDDSGADDAATDPDSTLDLIDDLDPDEDPAVASWAQSQLNPKNRIDSLDLPKDPMWRIDGCTGLGTQFYMIPLFLDPAPPMRVDVFIPEYAEQSPHARGLLGLATAFHTKDAVRVPKLGISNYIIRALHLWSKSFADFPVMYKTLPFGSRIIFANLPLDLRDIRIQVSLSYNLERQMHSLSSLATLWAIPDPANSPFFPERVDLFGLEVLEQVHDSTSIVRYKSELYIFKAITSHTKYIYHELHNLLSIRPHPNLISRPRHLITKKCRFGSKTAIVGFTLEYHAPGTLRDIVPIRRLNGRLGAADQLRWAKQITSALLHLHTTGGPFYPDLRLDNVVLSTDDNAIMVDFEQRGVWCEFGPPEINALEYVRLLATDEETTSSEISSPSSSGPPSLDGSESLVYGGPTSGQDKPPGNISSQHNSSRNTDEVSLFTPEAYVSLLGRLLPGYETLLAREDYTEAGARSGGYNVAWLSLTDREREAAEVYMLGRVLYCIFEGVAAPNRAAVWQSYRWESDVDFPDYVRTPRCISELIDRCTLGRRPNLTSRLSRVGDKMTLVTQGLVNEESESGECGMGTIQEAAATFWKEEMRHAVGFLEARLAAMKVGTWDENHFGRPTLKEVHGKLEDISREMGYAY